MLQRPGAGKGSPKQARCAASHQRVRLHHTPPRRRVAAANETSLREHPNPNHISWTDLQNFEPAEFLAPGALRADCAVAAAQWSEGNLGPHGGPRWLRAALADARAGAPPVCVAWVEHPLYLLFERWHRTNVWHGLEDVAHAFEASALWGWGTDAQAVVVEGLHDVTMFEGARTRFHSNRGACALLLVASSRLPTLPTTRPAHTIPQRLYLGPRLAQGSEPGQPPGGPAHAG